jgi:RimJ/RimL family protein N-acetyltransferase
MAGRNKKSPKLEQKTGITAGKLDMSHVKEFCCRRRQFLQPKEHVDNFTRPKGGCRQCDQYEELQSIVKTIESRIIEGVFNHGRLISYSEKRRVPERDAQRITSEIDGAEKLAAINYPFSDVEGIRTVIRNYIIWGNYINEALRKITEVEEVRRLTKEDWMQFNFLRLQGLFKEPQNFGRRFRDEVNRSPADIQAMIEQSQIYGIYCADELIAVAAFEDPGIENPAAQHKRIISGVYVRPDKRRQGIADIITERLINIAKKEPGVKQINLTVTGTNEEAIALYKKFGFVVDGVQKDAVCIDGTNYDWIHMRLKLEHKETTEE